MKGATFFLFLLAASVGATVFSARAQTPARSGSIEFVVHATPSGGLEEPVRGFPLFLLTKSFQEITREVEASTPKADMDGFVDTLDVSPELKAWMKKNHRVELSGEDFIHKLKAPDVMNVPEFYHAYLDRNSGDQSMNFPKPKYKAADREKDPAKYDKLKAEYDEALRHYIEDTPESIDGIDLELANVDPSAKWNSLDGKRAPEIHRRVLELAQSKYLVARAQTDLEGDGYLRDIPPGNYWLSTLDVAANVGDARPRWDIALSVRAGERTNIALSSVNAVPPSPASP